MPPDQHGHTKPPPPSFRTVAAGLKPALPGHCRQSNAATRSQPCLVPRHGKSISGLLSVVPVTACPRAEPAPYLIRGGDGNPSPAVAARPTPPREATPAVIPPCSGGFETRPPRSLPSVQRRHTKPTLPRAPTREIHLRPTLRRSRDDGNPSPAVAARPTPPHEATPAVIPDCSGGFEPALPGHCRQSNAATRSHPCLVPISQPNAGPSRLATVRSSQAPALSGMRRRPVPMPGQGLLSPHRLGQVVRRQFPCRSRRRRRLGRG